MIVRKWNSKDTVCLDLSAATSYKQKKAIIDLLSSSGCKISFIVNKNVKYLIRDDRQNVSTYKCRTAFKLGIPVLHVSCVYDTSPNMSDYLIVNKKNDNDFQKGLIAFNDKKGRSP